MLTIIASLLLGAISQPADPGQQPWPTKKPGRVLSTPDWSDYRTYPTAAADNDEEGNVGAEMLIGIDGASKECRITATSTFPELDAGTCDLMMQMRFEPARDESGRPVQSKFARAFVWRLTDPLPFASGTLTLRTRIYSGQLTACSVAEAEGPYVEL